MVLRKCFMPAGIRFRPPQRGALLWTVTALLVTHNLLCEGDERRTFYALSDLTYDRSAKTVLINAYVANPKDFPSVFYSSTSGGPCTVALVGTNVLMTAAHCVNDGEVVRISASQGMYTYNGPCTRAPKYNSNPTNDWALCALDGEPSGVIHETVNSNNALVTSQTSLLLSGFGCAVAGSTSAGSGNVYRIGASTVAVLPSGNNDSLVMHGGAATCFGDSGGPAFVVSAATLVTPTVAGAVDKRLMVSVNSRGNIQDESVLASLSTPDGQAFLREWTDPDHGRGAGLRICGFSPGAQRCRKSP
jgi:hypothetical protein